jgi:hypothetical protein
MGKDDGVNSNCEYDHFDSRWIRSLILLISSMFNNCHMIHKVMGNNDDEKKLVYPWYSFYS